MPAWTLRLVALASLLFAMTQALAALPPAGGLSLGLLGCLAALVVTHGGGVLGTLLHRLRAPRALPGRSPMPRPDA